MLSRSTAILFTVSLLTPGSGFASFPDADTSIKTKTPKVIWVDPGPSEDSGNQSIDGTTLIGSDTKKMLVVNSTSNLTYVSLENSQSMATLILGEVHDNTISAPGEVDTHFLYASSNAKIDLAIKSAPNPNGFIARLQLKRPDGALLGTFVAGSGNHSHTVTLPVTGWYQLQVSDLYVTRTGSYSIGLEGIKPASPNPVPLVKGGLVVQTTGRQLDQDQFSFMAQKDDVVQLHLTQQAYQSGYWATAKLVAPSGLVEATFVAGSYNPYQTLRLKENGKYILQVGDIDLNKTGKFWIGMETINPVSPNPVFLNDGQIQSGSITSGMDKRQFVFHGMKNEVVNLLIDRTRVVDAGFDVRGDIFDFDGNWVAGLDPSSLNNSEQSTLILPKTGTYLLQIQDFDKLRRGDFKISLNSYTFPGATAYSLAPNKTVHRSLTDALEKRLFSINLKKNQIFTVNLKKTSSQQSYRPNFLIYDVTKNRLSALWGAGKHTFTSQTTGKFLIIVFDEYYDQPGSFSLKWNKN